jgi:glycosyltransferase involved in cell wall biosynthesis
VTRIPVMRRRVVFVCPEASRTGAPLMLLHFLRWLRDHADLDFSVLFTQGGELSADFAAVAPVSIVRGDPPGAGRAVRLVRRVGWADGALHPLPDDLSRLERVIRAPARRVAVRDLARRAFGRHRPDLVYLNSIGSAAVLRLMPEHTPVITHVHELGFILRLARYGEPAGIAEMLARTQRYIAASNCGAAALAREYGVAPRDIRVCYGFIPIEDTPVTPASVEHARKMLGLAPDTLVVGMVGSIDWIKGADLFVQVAKRVVELLPGDRRVVFLWVGAASQYWWEEAVRHDIQALGLEECVRFIGAVADPRPVVELFDVFLLASRSDNYPLACLEAAAQAKPIACFDAGGMTEFLEPDDRLVVPYLDTESMARRITELLDSRSYRQILGDRLARRVRQRHRLELAAPVLLEEIHRVLNGARM